MTIRMFNRFEAKIWPLALALLLFFAPLAPAVVMAQETATDAAEDVTVEAPAENLVPDQSDIVATIGQYALTEQELAREFANRGTQFGPDLALAQQRLRDAVIAEYWVEQNFSQLAVRNRLAALALGEARRQILFEVYAQSTFPREDITEENIAAYIEANSNLFKDRRSYIYQRMLVTAQDRVQLDAVRQALEGLSDIGQMPSDFAPRVLPLAGTGANLAVTRQWASSESLATDLRPRLHAMSDEGKRVDIVETGTGFDVLVLIDFYDDPMEPARLQNLIVSRIQQERYIDHRLDLAQSIAEPLIGTLPEPVQEIEFKPTAPILAASAFAGAIFGLVMAMFISWTRTARVAAEVMEQASLGDFRPSLRNHPIFVRVVVIVLFFVLLAEIFLGLLFGPLWLRTLEVLAAFFGLLVLGVVLGLLIWRAKNITDENAPRKLRWARRRSLLSAVLVMAGGAILALRPGPVVSLIDYLTSAAS